jgi:hypothetical protein
MNDSEAPILLIDDTEFQIVRHFKGQLYGEEPECEVVSGCSSNMTWKAHINNVISKTQKF